MAKSLEGRLQPMTAFSHSDLAAVRPVAVTARAAGRWRALGLAVALSAAALAPAAAQSITSAPPPPVDLSLAQGRIVELERALRDANASADQLSQENFRLRLENERLKQALDAAQSVVSAAPPITSAPQRPTPPISAPPTPRPAVAVPATPPQQAAAPQDEQSAFRSALALAQRDPAAAETALREFVRLYPNSTNVPEAVYFIGRTQYVQQKWNAAAATFIEIVERTPRAPRAPDALVWLGAALRNDGAASGDQRKITTGCNTIRELNQRFPNASQRTREEAAQELNRAAAPGGVAICRSGS